MKKICDDTVKSFPIQPNRWEQEFCQLVSALETPVSPLTDWGKTQRGDLAYSFGGLVLLALEDTVGTAVMDQVLQKCCVSPPAIGLTSLIFTRSFLPALMRCSGNISKRPRQRFRSVQIEAISIIFHTPKKRM